ncbi:hypothetical protein [Streptomyces sp. RPT161]|uniref:hypothetical protein n=1 Tax=Streptomyces sp. RPT161 TaxID=3015993 RepID=UPI0022B8E490|nr:hypothetical protein [Streptomyces sp. RPT161]
MKRWDTTRRDSRRFVRELDLPPADNIRELLPAVQERTGYSIRIAPAPELGTRFGLCGMWIRTTDGIDYVFVHEKTSRAHQDHIIAHELAHILRDHQDTSAFPAGKPVGSRLISSLEPAAIKMMLGRSDYEYQDEREAELIGSYLQRHVHRPHRPVREGDRVAETLLRTRR